MKDQHYAQVNELENITVSYSHNTHNPYLIQTTLGKILDRIQNDTELYNIIDSIRSHSDKEERRKLKEENLPYFVLGTFKNNHRKSDNLISTQFISIDFDNLNGNAAELDEKLKADENVFTFFKSPSNNRKVIYKLDKPITDRTEYSRIYSHFIKKLNNRYRFEADKQTSDAARAIFLSYDPDIYVNPDAEPLDTSWIKPVEKKSDSLNLKKLGKEETKYIPSAVKYLKNKINNYKDWLNCGFALASLGEAGREYFIELSDNPKYQDTQDEINKKFDNCLTRASGDVTLATLFQIAKDYGYDYPEQEPKLEIATDRLNYAAELRERFDLDDNRDPNKPLGFPLTKFRILCDHLDGLQPGFYHLGAESNIGKTAVLTNLALDLLNTNPDVSVMYFSFDDSRRYTAYRFLSILSQLHINYIQKPRLIPQEKNKITKARTDYLNLIDTNRLIVKDLGDLTHIDQLQNSIAEFGDLSKLAVFIDGLYNLEVLSGGNEGIRIENIERAQKVKLIVDSFKIPLLSTGELRKKMKSEGKNSKPTLHDLMETGKYAYNANVVWLLSELSTDYLGSTSNLNLQFAKNKLSDFKGDQSLIFERATGTIKEGILMPTHDSADEEYELGGEIE